MKIGIDCRMLQVKYRSGVQEYTEQLLAHLLPLRKDIQYVLLFSSLTKSMPQYWWLYLNNVKVKQLRWLNIILFSLNRYLNWPKLDRILRVDVFFSPHIFPVALSDNCQRVTTIHDLSFVRFPEYFSRRQRGWHSFQANPKKQCQLSNKIIAMSESTKNDLVLLYDSDPAKIEVIYSGTILKRPLEKEIEVFKKYHDLPDRYLFYLGTLEPRKNITGIIKAFTLLKQEKYFGNLDLILGGVSGWLYEDIFKLVENSHIQSQIHLIDYISDQREFYYSGAEVFLYPSHFEGFGLPVLEAMACGTPVVTSNRSSLPEVAGEAAILVDPNNVSMIADAIKSILTDSRLRSRLIKSGLARAQQFSWEVAAQKTLDIIVHS